MSERTGLVLTPDFPPEPGGIQRLLERLVRHSRRIRWEVLAPDVKDAAAWDRGQPFRVHRISSFPGTASRRAAIMRLNAEALFHARRLKPDVVLAGHIVASPGAAAIRRLLGVPVVTYLHALEVKATPAIAAHAVRSSDAIIAVSRYTAGLAREAGAPEDRIHIIPPGVDLVERATAPGPRQPVVLTVARLHNRYKGHDVIARALPLVRARVPEARWAVVGEGPLRRDVERLTTAYGVREATQLCGVLPDSERDELLDTAGVLAMPSRVPPGQAGEGFGIVYLEAAARGLPSVAGNVGGAVDAVVDGETGRLVDPEDHIAVADAIADVLADRDLAARMGAAGAARAREFAWPRIAERVEDLLLQVAA